MKYFRNKISEANFLYLIYLQNIVMVSDWGYVELAGIVRYIKWVDQSDNEYDLSDEALGWGLNLSSNLKITKNDVLRLAFVYGEGIQNYMNDAPVDIGIKDNTDANDPEKPIKGVPIPMMSAVAFLDHNWSEKFSTSVGYSFLDMDNTDLQDYDAFNKGQYALINLLYYPVANVMMGAEVQCGLTEKTLITWKRMEKFNIRKII
ncbi:MAG: hypothetical protein MZV64_06875 [Ignavibacteriales bacterium]|nr:hypothetical protein [Ignavibacteriales bacterium]